MAVQVKSRPIGYTLPETANTTYSITGGTVLNSDARIGGGSGLSTDDVIYIKNSIDRYNGFWRLIGTDPFQVRKLGETLVETDALLYVQDFPNAEIYLAEEQVDASCVHMPIVYEFYNNLWPPNGFDLDITQVVSFSNDNGYVRVELFAALSDINALDYMYLYAAEEDVTGSYLVLTRHSTSSYTISLPYSVLVESPYVLLNAFIEKYYNNYRILVRIYGGLKAAHTFQPLKPYEIITELSLVPATNRIAKLNVAEVLKEKLKIGYNRPNYDSSPYDLDRFCNFYVEYAESYDQSDGLAVTTYTSSYTSDSSTFEGIAVDAKLPFKNIYSGFLSEYYCISEASKFLSDGTPSIWAGEYFDLSFLKGTTPAGLQMVFRRYDANDNLISTTQSTIVTGEGVIRKDVSVIGSEAKIIVQLKVSIPDIVIYSEEKTIKVKSLCAQQSMYMTWKNHLGGFNYWLFTSNKDYNVEVENVQQIERNIFPDWPESYGKQSDTIRAESARTSTERITLRAEQLDQDEVIFLSGIRKSSLVQQLTSKYDRRTWRVDPGSFKIRTDNEGMHTMEFDILDTAPIPSQTL